MKTKTFTHENYSNDSKLKSTLLEGDGEIKKFFTDGTVLIPDGLFDHYRSKVDTLGVGEYFIYLLKNYRSFLKLDPEDIERKLNLGYQIVGLELHKENIHVECEVWAELKMWKSFLNWSVCRIVTYLVQLDLAGIAEELPERFVSLVSPLLAKFFVKSKIVFSTKMSSYVRRHKIRRFDYE